MAISKTMAEALNKQFNEELASAYLYDSMAADFYAKNLPGFAMWMTQQAAEERTHAVKIHRYLDEHGERVYYAAMGEPQAEWASPATAFEAALAHEKYISGKIHELVRLARKEDDIPTESFLIWFVNEQVEEESTTKSVLDKIEMVSDNKFGLYQLDKEMAARGQK
jgi:ferritin